MKILRKFLFLIMILFLTQCSNEKNNSLNLLFFDVNQGDSSFINYNDVSILIDTGEEKFVDNVIKTLKGKSIKTIDYLILTHDHSDHASGFNKIYNNFNIQNIILPGVFKNETFLSVKRTVDTSKTNIMYIDKPSTLNIQNDFSLNFLSDFSKPPTEFNDSSLVFRAQIKEFDILYTGDIEENGQLNLMDKNIKSEILKVPHHGAYNNDKNNVEKFISKVSPYISIISVGENSYDHPNKNTLSILKDVDSKILRTDELGNISISCDFNNNSLTINSFI